MNKLILFSLFTLATLMACEKDETKAVLDPAGAAPQITAGVTEGFTKVITESNGGEVLKFGWNEAEYGVNTPVNYVLEIDSIGRSFSHPATLGSTSLDSLRVTLADLNAKLLSDLRVTPNEESTLQVRVRATVNGGFEKTSDPVTIKITPWKIIEVEKPASLWVPGGYQGWDPANAPVIYAIGETVFEGYVYLNGATGFKFTSAPDWNHINYGDSGTPGVLTVDGLAPSLGTGTPGYYKFKVDVENLTYEMTLINTWGAIGTATPGGWDSSTPLTFDVAKGVWTKTLDLGNGALKFRANNDWGINYGPEDSNVLSGILIQTDGAISIPESGNYTVTIDLGRSKSPYKYAYTVTKN